MSAVEAGSGVAVAVDFGYSFGNRIKTSCTSLLSRSHFRSASSRERKTRPSRGKISGIAPKKLRHLQRDQKRYVRRGKNLEACEGSDRNNMLRNALTSSRPFVIQKTPEPTCKEAERLRLVNQPRAIWETAKLSSNI